MIDLVRGDLMRSLHMLEARARSIREHLGLVEEDRDVPSETLAAAEAILDARRRLAGHLPGTTFADPAFDILLDLYVAARRNEDRVIKTCTIAARVPQSTATRWIGSLVAAQLVRLEDDLLDRRRTIVRLSPRAIDLIHASLAKSLMIQPDRRNIHDKAHAPTDRTLCPNRC